MPPFTATFLPGRCLHPKHAHGKTFFQLLSSRALHDPARGRFTLFKKHLRPPHIFNEVQIQALPSSVRVGATSTLLPSAYVYEAEFTCRSSLNRSCFRSFSSAILFDASVPGLSSSSTSTSRPPSSSSSSSSTSPQSTSSGSSSSTFVEKRVHTEKTPASGSPVKAGSTSSATASVAAKRLTGLHKICDLKGPLASFMGKSEASRIEVIKHVWDHIKRHNLQSAENKKMINADHALKPILQKDQVSMFEMNKLLSKYVQSRPITSAGARD